VSRVEAQSATSRASAREDTDSLVRKIALLVVELAEIHWAHEVVEETTHGSFNTAFDAERPWEESERGHRE
jgi:hypothetical protein